jgi:hypothetical protein
VKRFFSVQDLLTKIEQTERIFVIDLSYEESRPVNVRLDFVLDQKSASFLGLLERVVCGDVNEFF